MSENEMLEEIKSLSPSEEAILTMLIRYQNLKAELEKEKEKNKELKEKEKNLLIQLKDSEKELLEVCEKLRNSVGKDKIKAKIEELEIEQESNREDLKIAIDNLLVQNIDKIANKISINMSIRGILESLLEKE